jgi:hypothetical protein
MSGKEGRRGENTIVLRELERTHLGTLFAQLEQALAVGGKFETRLGQEVIPGNLL